LDFVVAKFGLIGQKGSFMFIPRKALDQLEDLEKAGKVVIIFGHVELEKQRSSKNI